VVHLPDLMVPTLSGGGGSAATSTAQADQPPQPCALGCAFVSAGTKPRAARVKGSTTLLPPPESGPGVPASASRNGL